MSARQRPLSAHVVGSATTVTIGLGPVAETITVNGEPRGIPRHCRHAWQGSVELNWDGPDDISIVIEVAQSDNSRS
jgi:hypothetical protein